MNDEKQKISGYRELTQFEINMVNDCKKVGASLEMQIDALQNIGGIDQRCVSLAKTNLQQGLMWLGRSITKPVGF